jgi:ribosomal protein S18
MLAIAVAGATQAPDTWNGTWKLNLAKSSFDPAALAPKSQTVKREAVAGGGMKGTVDTVDSAGKAIHVEVMTMFDGKASDVKGAPDPHTTRVYKRIDSRNFEYVQSVNGKLTVTVRTMISADGKTATTNTTGKNAQGQTVHNVAVADKQ